MSGQSALGQTMVHDIVINGNQTITAQKIRGMLKTQPGTTYLKETVDEDVRTLHGTKFFANVDAVVVPNAEKVTVHFNVREYPSVVQRVVFLGAKHLKEDELIELTRIRPNTPLSPIQNKLACRAIEQKLFDEGRLFAQCSLLKGDQPGDTEVVFNITEGPKLAIQHIHFTGNNFVGAGVLRTHLISQKKFLGLFKGEYNPGMVQADINKLEEYYRNFGFFDVEVARELRLLENGRDLELVYHIKEGLRYQLDDTPQIHGLKHVPIEQVSHLVSAKAGDIFNQQTIDRDLRLIKDHIGYTGREVNAQAMPVFHRDRPGVVTMHYQVEERPPARVGYIYVVGNTRTRMDKILNQIPLFPGQVLSYPEVRRAERNLARLNIFKSTPDGSVRPTITVLDNPFDPNSEYKDLLVTVEEDNTGSLMFGLGVNSDSGLTGSVVLNERNFDISRFPTSLDDLLSGNAFRGGNQQFRLEAMPGTDLQRYSAEWRDPHFLNSDYSLGVGGYYRTFWYNEYRETRLGGRVSVGRELNEFWRVNGSTRIENVKIASVPLGAPADILESQGNNFQVGLGAGVSRDTRDSLLRPTEGNLATVNYEQVFGDFDFPNLNAEFNQYFPVYERADGSGRHVVAFRTQVSWTGPDTPVYERYYAGGIRTIRGFDFRGVGPDIDGFKVGGKFMWLNSLEYQVPILANDKLYGVAFVDSGTVESDVSLKNYRVSAGVGVRVVVPMLGPVPIALDFGVPIVKAPFDDERIFNFWVGFTR